MNYVGQLLVAPPCQDDDFWENSVIFIYEDAANTIGLTLNKLSDRSVEDLSEYHKLTYLGNDMVHLGGLMNTNALIMIHTDDWSCTNTMYVNNGIRISSDHTMLSRICSGDKPRKWRLFLGMCIWSHGQLNNEIDGTPPYSKKKSWLLASPSEDIIFEKHPKKMWNKALEIAIQEATNSFFLIT